ERRELPRPAHGLSHDPRPDEPEPTGERRRHPVSLGDLLPLPGSTGDRGEGARRARDRRDLEAENRDRARAVLRVLPGGGVPPGLFPTESGKRVLPRHHRPEGLQVPKAVRRASQVRLSPPPPRGYL